MATITKQTIYLDLTPGKVFPVLHVSQGDTGLEALEFKLVQNGMVFNIPAAVTDIQLNGTTPLGVFSYNHASGVDWSGNTVTANVTETMTAERGLTLCELRLLDSTLNSIGTLNFVIAVEPSPFTNAHVSTSDMATIMAALNGSQRSMLLSKSWAVGNTGMRDGEDTNNSKYWSEQSDINGERWSVGQIDGSDVPSSDVTYHNNSKWWSSISESWAVGGTGDRTGEDTNNSKYYADQSRIEGNGLASVFSDVLNYSEGDYVIHDGILYEFTRNHSAGEWSINDVHVVNMGDEVADLNSEIKYLPKWMHGNLILDEIHDRTCFMQGACYIGNNQLVGYYSDANGTDTGMLRCFDLSEYALLWEHPIKGYHGNAVCYRPKDNCVYMCGAFLASDTSTLINKVVVVSLDNPSVVKQEISAPMPLYSIAYDADTDTFYSISSWGTTDGEANRLYRYNGVFASVAGTVDLEKYIGTETMRSSQGASLIHNGIIYNIGYDDQTRYVTGNYIDTGKIAIIAHIPDMINGYRAIGEVENIIYMPDSDSFLIGASSVNSGVHGKVLEYWFEVDLYHGIYEYMAYPVPGKEGYEHDVLSSMRLVLNVVNGAPSLKPCQMLGDSMYKCVIDAVNMALTIGAYAYINLTTLHGGVTEIGNINLSRFHGVINGATMNNVYSSGDSDITFVGCRFTESTTYTTYQANVIVANNNKYYFDRCVFDDFEITDGVSEASHIFAYDSGKFTLYRCTFSGNKRRYITVFSGAVAEIDMYQWKHLSGKFTPVSDTYVYTGLSFTVPQDMFYRVYFETNYDAAEPTGMGLAKSDTAFHNGTIVVIYEKKERPAKHSPEYVLSAGTYYLWVRKAGSDANSEAHLFYRADPIG